MFVPVVQRLPIKNIITKEEKSEALTGKPNQNLAVSHENTTTGSMSDPKIFKAEIVFIKDSVEGGAGNMIQAETKLEPPLDYMNLSQTSTPVGAQSENTPKHVADWTASMETAVDKHGGISQWPCQGTSGRTEPHKIKLSYKSLAAIPTNTLLLDQQAIDEQVEREESPCDLLDRGVDTHAEMCSPAQLRQQSEELYATIDEILANSIPASKSSPQTSRSSTPAGVQNHSSFPRSLGRETKYASLCSLQPSAGIDKKLMDHKKTKPGVIRPMTAIPRLRVEDEEEFHPNPFRQFVVNQTSTDNKKVENMSLQETGKNCYTSSKVQTLKEERKPERRTTFSLCDLQIIEPDDLNSHPVKDVSTCFNPTKGRMEAFETHI